MNRRPLSDYLAETIDYFVRQVPFFDELARLDRPQFDLLMAHSHVVEVALNETIIQKGEVGEYFYSLVHGRLGVFSDGDSNSTAIGEVTASQLVGVLSIINKEPRTATVAVLSVGGATVFETDFSVIGELNDFSQIKLSTKISLCREVVRRIRTMLEMSQRASNDSMLAEELSTLMQFEGVAGTFEELEHLVELASGLTWLLEHWNGEVKKSMDVLDGNRIKEKIKLLLDDEQ